MHKYHLLGLRRLGLPELLQELGARQPILDGGIGVVLGKSGLVQFALGLCKAFFGQVCDAVPAEKAKKVHWMSPKRAFSSR